MKWFGDNVHNVKDAVVVPSGQLTPVNNFVRGEGVTFVLRGRSANAFVAGQQWMAASSLLLVVKLQFILEPGKNQCVHEIVCHAPTFRNSGEEKWKF